MPQITVKDGQTFTAATETRLVLALEDHGEDILHRCGGFAGCTTCRVIVHVSEPTQMTEAEFQKLQSGNNLGKFRLSCQILCDHDMTVEPLMRISTTEYEDAGKRPQDSITPEPVIWMPMPTRET